jgi:dTDP-4-dehydrorhamnose reductase
MKSGRELLVFGAGGMLGTALKQIAEREGLVARAYSETELDITDRSAVQEAVADFAAHVARLGVRGTVVNAAAYTDVEKAEDDAERAYLVNALAAGWLAAAGWKEGLGLVHVSTDFVFDGTQAGSYSEDDEPHPINVYGSSKLAGEKAVFSGHPAALVVRTAWTYGPGGTNFPLKIVERARAATSNATAPPKAVALDSDLAAPALQVVADEMGSPTYSVDLADGLVALLAARAAGLYLLAGGGSCSRYELALETLRLAGFSVPSDIRVQPVASAAFPTRAVRPHNSALDCAKAAGLGVRLPAWQDGLARFMAEL